MFAPTGELPCGASVTVDDVNVAAFMATEKVAVGSTASSMPALPPAGVTAMTVGAVVSEPEAAMLSDTVSETVVPVIVPVTEYVPLVEPAV
jgi:hypothetical protein